MTSPLISLRDVSVTYPGAATASPAGVSFDVYPGEVVLLTGPSGCGKSSIAVTLNGLIPHDIAAELSGEVRVAGVDTREASVSDLSRAVAMVFQDPDAQIVSATVLDEVSFALENLKLPVDDVLVRAEKALRQVGLWQRRRDNPDVLSGGGRQRLAIACALAMQTPVIVLDEPTANLDPEGVRDVYAALEELCRDRSRAIVLVEHNAQAAAQLATRVIEIAPVLPTSGGLLPRTAGAQLSAGTHAPVLSAQGLNVERGGTRVISDASIEVFPGELLTIIGPNGAGKTTLAHALAGVKKAPHGTVFLAGEDLSRMSSRDVSARIGFVFQNPEHQFITGTVREELAHGLQIRGVAPPEITTRTNELLERFGLSEAAERHPFLLSGGQKRRLSVGTALITEPEILVLDEPTFGQDAARTAELIALFDELRAEGTAIVAITHDPALIEHPDARKLEVRDGQVAPPSAHPVTPIVNKTDTTPVAAATWDPFAAADAAPRHWLHAINPLAKLLALLPAILALAFTRDIPTPTAFLALAFVLLLTGAKLNRRTVLSLFVILPITAAALALGFSLWTSTSVGDPAPLVDFGPIHLTTGQVENGIATSLRFSAMIALAFVAGITSTGPDITRAAVQHLKVPYRVGYASLASYRFVPRFQHELELIRAAHRVRGHHGGSGPFAAISRGIGAVVPMLAGGIRHAERVALAMDSRAFGAFETRTERYLVPWRTRDTVFCIIAVLVTAAIFILR